MAAALIVDAPMLIPVLLSICFPTLEGGKTGLAKQCKGNWRSDSMTPTQNWTWVACMVAQWFTHYATAASRYLTFFYERKRIKMVIPSRMVSYSTNGLNIFVESSMVRFWKMSKCYVSIHYHYTIIMLKCSSSAYNAKWKSLLCSLYVK